MKFTKIPVQIEAFRVEDALACARNAWQGFPIWLAAASGRGDVVFLNDSMLIKTLEGMMTADRGDWIIQGVKGELYPCKPDIFALTYQPEAAVPAPEMSDAENALRTEAGQPGVFGTERCAELLTQANALGQPTYGEKAVGLSLNPGGNPAVNACKQSFAGVIDSLDELRRTSTDPEAARLASVAITQAQTAQMWAVKAITWSA